MGLLKDMGGWFKMPKASPDAEQRHVERAMTRRQVIPQAKPLDQRNAEQAERQELDDLRAQRELSELRNYKAQIQREQTDRELSERCQRIAKITGQNSVEMTMTLRQMNTEQRLFMFQIFDNIEQSHAEAQTALSDLKATTTDQDGRIFPDQLAKAQEASDRALAEIASMNPDNYTWDDERSSSRYKVKQ